MKNQLCSAISALVIVIGASASFWTANASAQTVPTWEQTGLLYLWYVDSLTYAQDGEISPAQAASIAGAYGANPGAYAYWQYIAYEAPEPYYEAGSVQFSYYSWYGANAAAVAWPQGAEYQAFVYEYWYEYGSSVGEWYYAYGDFVYNYYDDIAVYYFNLIYPIVM